MILDLPDSPGLRAVIDAARAEPSVRSAHLVGGAVRDRIRRGEWGLAACGETAAVAPRTAPRDAGVAPPRAFPMRFVVASWPPADRPHGAPLEFHRRLPVPDLDVVFEGDARAVARRLDGDVIVHEPFGTATWHRPDGHVDLVTARSETYPAPGALPDVAPSDLGADLRRRDFTVNAIALRLWPDPGRIVDPLGGATDLAAGVLRAHHPRSFADDPTRLLRAARYAVRLGLDLEPESAAWTAAATVSTVSGDRWLAEWRQLLVEPDPGAVLRWLGAHGFAPQFGLDPHAPPLSPFVDRPDGWLGALAVAAASERPLQLSDAWRPRLSALRAPPPDFGEDDLTLERAVKPMSPLRQQVIAVLHPDLAASIARGAALAAEPPLLRGADLVAAGLPPGPGVGEALRRVRRARRLEGLATAEAALAMLRAEGLVPIA